MTTYFYPCSLNRTSGWGVRSSVGSGVGSKNKIVSWRCLFVFVCHRSLENFQKRWWAGIVVCQHLLSSTWLSPLWLQNLWYSAFWYSAFWDSAFWDSLPSGTLPSGTLTVWLTVWPLAVWLSSCLALRGNLDTNNLFFFALLGVYGFWGINLGLVISAPHWASTNPWESHLRASLGVDSPQGSGVFVFWVQGCLVGSGEWWEASRIIKRWVPNDYYLLINSFRCIINDWGLVGSSKGESQMIIIY